MAIALLVGRNESERATYQWFIDAWKQSLLAIDPSLDIRAWPNIGNPDEIDWVGVWSHPLGSLTQFKHAKAIYSLAAGVDHVLVDPEINPAIPLLRLKDPYMANDIMQYVIAYVLKYVKRIDHWAEKQNQKTWFKQPPFTYSDKSIGVMGLGYLGRKAATLLHELGLTVNGWSQTVKAIPGIHEYAGQTQLTEFLAQTDILICMLPLTPQTDSILNLQTFSKLKQGAYLINVGRGQHLVESDLLRALDTGILSGACLDVFRQEPLPSDHPFWTHPNITVTPHIASVTNPITAAKQFHENYLRAKAGKILLNQVDLQKGY